MIVVSLVPFADGCPRVRSRPVLRPIRPCPCSNLHKAEKDVKIFAGGRTVTVMDVCRALVSIFEFPVRGRASLELELIALHHQVTVLRRQRPGRPQLSSLDRLLSVGSTGSRTRQARGPREKPRAEQA